MPLFMAQYSLKKTFAAVTSSPLEQLSLMDLLSVVLTDPAFAGLQTQGANRLASSGQYDDI